MQKLNAIEVLAEYAGRFSQSSLPPAVLHSAKRAVIDWHAALYPGIGMAPVVQLEQAFSEDLDHGLARLVWGRQATVRAAALINGTAAHVAEIDDSFKQAMYHPGAATIAAARAAAQHCNASGEAFLRAVVLGYEVSTRIGVVLGRSHYRYWHNTGTVGCFGAAAAASVLFGLNAHQCAHALATVATFSAGLQQAFHTASMSKALHAGRAAEAGVAAVMLAAQGVTGSLDILDGEFGLGQAMSDGPDWEAVGADLGEVFNIERLTFKNHIGCGHTFAAIDGAMALRKQHQVRPEDIKQVTVASYRPAIEMAHYERPKDENEARFSLRYLVAHALVHGSVRLDAYLPERLESPLIQNIIGRMQVSIDPALDAAFPGQRSAKVSITLQDGRTLHHFQPDRIGDPEAPLTDSMLSDKFLELARPYLGPQEATALLDKLWQLEKAESVR